MSLKGVVYDPPRPGLPYIAVVLDDDNQVVSADSVPSVAAGEALIAEVFARFKADKEAGRI